MTVRGLELVLPIFSVFMLPGEVLDIPIDAARSGPLFVQAPGDVNSEISGEAWKLIAPGVPGIYALTIANADNSHASTLKLVVLEPFSSVKQGSLQGYRIGEYPPPREGHGRLYALPRGFVEVTAANRNTRLSPHFTLAQFLCKQESGYPKYLVLQEKLLLLLEELLQEVRREGYEVDSFGFISGYRTPWYNHKIGNVKYSRHVYGDAVDIFIDVDGDGKLDDLNSDGSRDRKDVEIFYKLVERFRTAHADRDWRGGIGKYQRNSRHGGFIHLDTRGYAARW